MGALHFGSLFGRSFSSAFSGGGLLTAVTLLFMLPSIGLELFTSGLDVEALAEQQQVSLLGWLALGFFASFFFSQLAAACVSYGVLQMARGQEVTLGAVLAKGGARVLRVFLVMLLVGLLGALCLVPVVVLAALMGPLSVLVLIGAAVVLVHLLVTYAPLVPVLVAEEVPMLKSFARCRELTDGNRGPILGGLVALLALNLLAETVIYAVFAAGKPSGYLEHPPASLTFTTQLVSVFFTTVIVSFQALVYHDLRANKEGLTDAEITKLFD